MLIVPLAEMDHEIAQGDVLGRFQCALDLIHGVDAPGLVGVQHIHAKTAGCGPFRGQHTAGRAWKTAAARSPRNHSASSATSSRLV
jgi:hypothetical protein